ncbi:hypothetical protein GALMADRAFT_61111 [Galerina marginata CBS 339.88]|uniref:Uncharacterized protein n=1 Tax=Galerina marginata (strain CBS 339.88) TaxID=685588 RepID=A0A067TFK0_GALM3|nr:hypothetical protein GALMADRAFT_61111 [Galerina marginata CBS 339.88]
MLSSRNQMFDTRSDKVAILAHAGLWSWNSDLRSGNFVPPGKKAPEGLPDSRMQTELSYKCEVTYTIETSVDESIYVLFKALESHVCSRQNFNRSKRERRKWQDGTERQRFAMSSKIVVKKSPFNTTQGTPLSTPYETHPWVLDALNDQAEQVYIANPESPRYLERQGEVLVDLFDTEDSNFRRGDIIWFSFKLGFYVNRDHWAPEIIPIAFIRVAVSPDPPVSNPDYSSYTTTEDDYDELKAGTIAIPIPSA